MMQPGGLSPSAGVKFLDRGKVLAELRKAASCLKEARREVVSVYLGSLARGDYTGGSDADILVVVKGTSLPFVDRIIEFRRFFLDCSIPVDVLVYTQKELEKEDILGDKICLG
jgi:predicted nucleotidyltransferase